jgi:hypothetical protein
MCPIELRAKRLLVVSLKGKGICRYCKTTGGDLCGSKMKVRAVVGNTSTFGVPEILFL